MPHTLSSRKWLWPGLVAVVLFIGNLASNLGATWLVPLLEPYQNYVWAVIILALVVAIIVAVREGRSHSAQNAPSAASLNLHAQGDLSAREVIGRDQHIDQSISVGNVTNATGVAIGTHARVTVVQQAPPVFNPLHQLPAPPADFTGREEELHELLAALESNGVLLSGVHGMGGIGKTALGLVLAAKLAPRFPDAQFFLDLRGVSTAPLAAAEAMAHVIRAYHPEAKLPETEAALAPLYHSVLHGQRALLFFDNVRDAEQVKPLLPPATCLLLLTSRRHFALPGLYAKDLHQLAPAAAEALLLKICSRIAAFAPELARLCGYLPLALRLAAGALAERRDLSPRDYAQRLQHAQTRVALVEASLRLSYDLLTPGLQAQWRALAVFPASFARSAAAAVWEIKEEASHEALSTLLNYSLLDWEEHTQRYRLHDLARLFAEARLEKDEHFAAQQQHAEHFRDVLYKTSILYLQGNDALLQSLRLFDSEWPNIAAGQAWAVANMSHSKTAARLCNDYPSVGAYVLNLRQHPRERITWLESALAAVRILKRRDYEGPHLGNLGLAYADLGEPRRAIEYHEQALQISREIGNRRAEGQDLGSLGLAYADLGETRRAIEFYEQQLVITREIGDRRGEGTALGNLGSAYAALGETRRAIEFYEQQLVITREIGDRRGEGNALGNLGNAYSNLGETHRAIEHFEQILKIHREIGDRRGEGADLGNLGLAYAALGETRRATEYHEQYLVIAREIGDRRGEGNALGNLGNAYSNLGETRRAIEYYEQYLVIAREIGDRRGEGNASFNMSLAFDQLGERDRALPLAETALQIYEQIEDPNAEQVRRALAEWRSED